MSRFSLRRKSLSLLLFFCASFVAALPLSAQQAAQNLLPQGAFDARGEQALKEWSGTQNAKIIEENGNRFLRFSNTNAANSVMIETKIKLAPEWKTLRLKSRMRATIAGLGDQGWFGARMTQQFINDKGLVQPYPPQPNLRETSREWVQVDEILTIPDNATHLQMTPGLWGTAGTFDLDDISVQVGDTVGSLAAAKDAPLPAGAQMTLAQTEAISATRARLSLNGLWRFMPGQTGSEAIPNIGWGWMPVPGNWLRGTRQDGLLKGVAAAGQGPMWQAGRGGALDWNQVRRGWYQQRIKIPADWQGRDIILNVGRVSTDATVFVDGKEAGKVNWPQGTVNLTNFVQPGQEATLTMLVVATLTKSEVMQLMGYANAADNPTVQATLQSAGIIGNVWLDAVPRGPRLEGVWVQTSTRRGELSVQAETSGLTVGQSMPLKATVVDSEGKVVKEWTAQSKVETVSGLPVVRATWKWPDAKLWDVGQPNLYTLKLRAQGAGIDDELAQRFGFREFWIEGKKLFLNGKEFRMRPNMFATDSPLLNLRKQLESRMEWGFNFIEFWPGDLHDRSNPAEYKLTEFYPIADELGLPISGIMPHMGWMGSQFDSPEKQAAFEAAVQRDWREGRNHPAIIMWGSSGNMTGGDIDPQVIGQREKAAALMTAMNADFAKSMRLGPQGIAIIKKYDPTRPVFIHHGGALGDIYTLNNYLTGIPLQEREEWLTHYIQKGDMPLWYVEWGTPHLTDFFRGRKGYGPTIVTEPLHTEHYAIYFGSEAYRMETKDYRDEIRGRFKGKQEYDQFHENWALVESPAFLKLQELFQTNTLRSYRTFGLTGGTIPWSGGYAERNGKITPAGAAMRANNGPTLAWIAGPARAGDVAAFTDKTHLYRVGERVEKRVAILNDTRQTQPYQVNWRAVANGKQLGAGQARSTIEVGGTKFEALAFALPANAAGQGEIVADVKIGPNTHSDRFAFKVFAPTPRASGQVAVYDPRGLTSAMLKAQGYTVTSWQRGTRPQFLVIGREALSGTTDGAAILRELETYVRGGGRAVVFNQNPQWMREHLGLRVSHKQARRVFPLPNASPVTAGLDAEDLRDWRGHSTLLDPQPDYLNGKGPEERPEPSTRNPTWGWRMGNRHTVSSAPVEKPHRSGWRPLLEADFDLSYSPLMELDFGAGRLIWCSLDLEERANAPVASRMVERIMNYARTAPLAPRVKTYYIGGEAGRKMLDALGVDYAAATTIPTDAKLLVYGPDANPDAAQPETFARGGGKVLFLARRAAAGALGAQLNENTKFTGSLNVPNWPEARGLSASDLRFRNEATAWTIANANGAEIGADGLLARRTVGNGVLLWAQLDPELLNADEKTYLRLTRWRQTRALSQLLANMGASFTLDNRVFHAAREPKALEIPLTGTWQAKLVQRRDAAPSPEKANNDPGFSEAARALVGDKVDTGGWTNAVMPNAMESLGGAWNNADGEAVFRTTVEVPAELRGKELILSLGSLDDFDEVFFNGQSIGKTGPETPTWWAVKRNYTVPSALVRPGANTIAVRIWDRYGGGGFTGRPDELKLTPRVEKTELPPSLYHTDYIEEFALSDGPHRYYNW